MNKKHVFIIIGVILCICIVATVIYLKVKYDEKRKTKSTLLQRTTGAYYTYLA